DIAELAIDGEIHSCFLQMKIAVAEVDRPESGEGFVRFDLALKERGIGGALVLERSMGVGLREVVVEDDVFDTSSLALQQPRKFVLVIVEEGQGVGAAGDEIADRSAG